MGKHSGTMSCIFCRIVSGDITANIIAQTEHSLAFMDAFPLAPGHTLVIPKRHCGRVQEMSDQERDDVFGLAVRIISRTDSIGGSTLMAIHNGPEAGQEIPHVHIHLVPRGKDDGAGPIHSIFPKRDLDFDATDMLHKLKGV